MRNTLETLRSIDPVDRKEVEDWSSGPESETILTTIVQSGAGPLPRTATQSRRRARFALATVAIGLVAAFVLGALPGDPTVRDATAAVALERAAGAVAKNSQETAPGPGEYAYSKVVSAYQHSYGSWALLAESSRETWVSPDGSGRFEQQPGDARFFGPRDEARCEAELGENECDAKKLAGGGMSEAMNKHMDVTGFGDESLDYEELKALPTDPDELSSLMRDAVSDATDVDYQMFVTIGDMLRQPLTPVDLRVALYEVAARIPNIELVGEVTDPLGRSGTAVAIDTSGHVTPAPEPGEEDFRHEIIFDEETGEFLAERSILLNRIDGIDAEPGDVIGWAAYVEHGVVGSDQARP